VNLFIKATIERAAKTFAQTLVALLSADSFGLLNAPWGASLSAAGMAAVLSVLTSIASRPVGESGTPSLVKE
jgi:hypothetical protein